MTETTDLVAIAPTPGAVPSRAVRVTLFEDRAEVVRRATALVPAGITWVTVAGVSAFVDDRSLVASTASGEARVVGVRVLRVARPAPGADEAELAAAEADHRTTVRRRGAAERALARAAAREARAAALGLRWLAGLGRVPRGLTAGVDAWRAGLAEADRALTSALDDGAAARTALEDARRDDARASARLTDLRTARPSIEALVEVQIEARTEGPLDLDFVYRTPCALWRPEHLCRLVPQWGAGGHELAVTTAGTAWQATGEVWQDVLVRFSTARPARAAVAPVVTDDVVTIRKKSEQERRTIVVEARDQAIALAGLERGTRAVDELPGVDDGGEPQWFEAARPVTIPSDGRPLRVELATAAMVCTVDRVAWPELTEAVHVRATTTLTAPHPLLAGPTRLVRGTELVGRGRLPFVARGAPFEVGFGVDDGLRVRRQVDERRETTPVIGTQKVTRTVRLYVSNLGDVAKKLTVVERVPVSELRDVSVEVTSPGGARFDGRDGFARFDVELAPADTRELTLEVRIEASAKVVLPSL